MEDQNKITYFGETDFRSTRTRFGIKLKDRTRHMYVIGKTGMGKSTLLENMAIQDIQNGEGMAFIDPHGGTAEKLLDYVPEHRVKDVVYFAPFDLENPISFNVLEDIGADKRHLVAGGLMSSFKKIWADAWSPRMEYILTNTLLALLEYPDATLLGVNRMLSDKVFRKKVVDNVTDPSVKSFWVDEFAKYTERFAAEATPAIQNKVGQFTGNPLIRNIIGQPKSSFDIRQLMDEKKILIINLSKGRVGEQNAALLGGMLITKIYLGAMSRADKRANELAKLPYFYFYVDEFQSFASDSFADILSEARKYKLSLTIAHQYIEQMSEIVRAAVFGNVGTMVIFRVGSFDAEIFSKEFAPRFTPEDIVNLGIFQIYLRLMIDGVGSKPFSATTMPPIEPPAIMFTNEVIEASRAQFARPRLVAEEAIKAWHEDAKEEPREKSSVATGEGSGTVSNFPPRSDRPAGERTFAPKSQTPPPPITPPNPALEAAKNMVRPVLKPKEAVVEKPAPKIIEKPVEKVFAAPPPAPAPAPVVPARTAPVARVVEKKPAASGSPKLKSILEMLEGKEAGSVSSAPEGKVAEVVTPPPPAAPAVPEVQAAIEVPVSAQVNPAPSTRPLFANAIKSKSPTRAASAESLSALREALGAVMAENASLSKPEPIVVPEAAKVPPEPTRKEPEVIFEPVPEIKIEPTPVPAPKPRPVPPVQTPPPFVSMPEPTPTGGSIPNEVPEDVLKKILE